MWRVDGDASGDDLLRPERLGWLQDRQDRQDRIDFFDRGQPVFLARAPGRLDLMGGIADYSGSLVLELPLARATWVAAQWNDRPDVVIESPDAAELGSDPVVTFPLAAIVPPDGALAYERAKELLTRDPRRAWAAYVAGALVVLHRERAAALGRGVRLLVRSEVPAGKGISSSAALEVAALQALTGLSGAVVDERALALLAQTIENFVVGAPCGVMDQMTAVSGQADHVIEILCQPAELRGHLPVPTNLQVFGIDSGIRHAVSGADYGSVRASAFMGYRIVAAAAGLTVREIDGAAGLRGRVAIDDPLFGGYLANLTPAVWHARFRDVVPVELDGRTFLDRYQGFTDTATEIDPDRRYAVRVCTQHPIDEHDRVRRFRDLLAAGAADDEACVELGALMYASHASTSACGLGSAGTDRLVELVRAAGPAAGFFGAKITGGGSGGTVAVLARRGTEVTLEEIAARYRAETGRGGTIFSGSSPGARAFGVHRLVFAR